MQFGNYYCKFEHGRLDEIIYNTWVSCGSICSYGSDKYDVEGIEKHIVVVEWLRKHNSQLLAWPPTVKSRSVPEGGVSVANLTLYSETEICALYCLVFSGGD
jgi:hypothetical protein